MLDIELHDCELDTDFVSKVENRRRYNAIYAGYYEQLYYETNKKSYLSRSQNIRNCYKWWTGDYYQKQSTFDLHFVNLCHDKFCTNCNHLKQATRLALFAPYIERLAPDYDFYHMSLTVPNVVPEDLKSTIDIMFKSFSKLIYIFSGKTKILNNPFLKYGYAGAVRCLEIAVNPHDFHPHIHCLLALQKDLNLYAMYQNDYSYSYGKFKQYFTELEILIQKTWLLLVEKQPISAKTIDDLPLGYSCVCKLVRDDEWKDVFKYVTKLENKATYLTCDQFKLLDYVLFKRRLMQGYGCFYDIPDEDSIDETVSNYYEDIIKALQEIEMPLKDYPFIIEHLISDMRDKGLKVISKRSIYQKVREFYNDPNRFPF